MKIPTPPYEFADVSRGPKEWYVYYSYEHPVTKKLERFKESTALNKKHNIPFRETIDCKPIPGEDKLRIEIFVC